MDVRSLGWLDYHSPEPAGIRERRVKGGRRLSKGYSPDSCLRIHGVISLS